MKLELIKKCSAKDILRCDKTSIGLRFTNRWSAFDVGEHPQQIPGKAEALCACAVKSFELAEKIGIPTHFIEQLDEVTIRVLELQVITDRPLTTKDTRHVVPAEWITRFFVAGSLLRKFKSGEEKPTDFGFLTDKVLAEGTLLPWPVNHFTTKFEKTDRDLTPAEARALCGLTEADERQYWAMINHLNGAINLALEQVGYTRLDGKIECGMGDARKKMIVDVFCTSDEDRPVPLAELNKGVVQHHSKEYLRQKLIEMGYYAKLKAARKAGKPDPPYPHLDEAVIIEASLRYKVFAKAYSRVVI